ncbi:MAG: hypothetical protein M3Y73_17635, partial [Actinomycetota bacterium]|nr:hypothetical protein [Actinomycetota bacterium]
MKKTLSALGATALAVAGLMVTVPANAATSSAQTVSSKSATTPASRAPTPHASPNEATGQYYWNCVGVDGSSYFLAPGAPTTDCKGSYLQKYLDGNQLAVYHLAYGGGAASETGFGCILATAGGVLLILQPELTPIWVLSAGVAAAGIVNDC